MRPSRERLTILEILDKSRDTVYVYSTKFSKSHHGDGPMKHPIFFSRQLDFLSPKSQTFTHLLTGTELESHSWL